MAQQDKGNKNLKKAATKAPKRAGTAKVPRYEQAESGITPPALTPKPRK